MGEGEVLPSISAPAVIRLMASPAISQLAKNQSSLAGRTS